ncbi:hypothetical protein D3C77_344710 [compost metagenome]
MISPVPFKLHDQVSLHIPAVASGPLSQAVAGTALGAASVEVGGGVLEAVSGGAETSGETLEKGSGAADETLEKASGAADGVLEAVMPQGTSGW